jgi:uncharacterized membrane protein YdjX (TVP38/TMEM64 family)
LAALAMRPTATDGLMRRFIPYLLLGLLVAIAIAAHLGGLADVLSFEAISRQRETLQDLVASHPVLAPLSFAAAYVAVAALALPVAAILSLLGGFLFGVWLGSALVLISATAGATIVFLLARSAFGEPLRRKAGPLYDKVAANMRENAFGYLLFMRLVPLFPFFLVNLVAALFDMTTRRFVLASLVGMAPATVIYVNFGRQLGTVGDVGDLLSPGVIGALTALGLLVLTPVIYRQWSGRQSTASDTAEDRHGADGV